MTGEQSRPGMARRLALGSSTEMNKFLPAREIQRLEVLWLHDILDAPPESASHDLTALAAHICQAPCALISLVEEKRQRVEVRITRLSSGPYAWGRRNRPDKSA